VNRRGRGLGRRAGSQRRLRRLPTRLGRDSRREIAGGPAPSTPSGRLARGITCPPPGVNRDPPAQAPAETIRPGGRPEEPKRKGASQSEAKIIPPRAPQPRLVGISGSGVAARAQRAHTGPEQQTCARALEGDVRGHGYRGACDGQGHKACWPRVRLASRWLHTCLGPVSWPTMVCPPPLLWNQGSASPRRRRELLTKSRRMWRRGIAEGTLRGM